MSLNYFQSLFWSRDFKADKIRDLRQTLPFGKMNSKFILKPLKWSLYGHIGSGLTPEIYHKLIVSLNASSHGQLFQPFQSSSAWHWKQTDSGYQRIYKLQGKYKVFLDKVQSNLKDFLIETQKKFIYNPAGQLSPLGGKLEHLLSCTSPISKINKQLNNNYLTYVIYNFNYFNSKLLLKIHKK